MYEDVAKFTNAPRARTCGCHLAAHDVLEWGVEEGEVHGLACPCVFGGRFSSQARNWVADVLLRHCTESGCLVFVVHEKCLPGLSSQLRVDLDAAAVAEDGSGGSAARDGEVYQVPHPPSAQCGQG